MGKSKNSIRLRSRALGFFPDSSVLSSVPIRPAQAAGKSKVLEKTSSRRLNRRRIDGGHAGQQEQEKLGIHLLLDGEPNCLIMC